MIVDVIVPVFNNFQLVRDCLESVIASDCETSFEFIVIDDGSSDEELKAYLRQRADDGGFTLLVNPENLGFTRTVNRGMALHPDRDVVLLNSDTVVYRDWLDRLFRAAYAAPEIATSNPMTNSNGSHISYYPVSAPINHIAVEVDDDTLDALAADFNRDRSVVVHVSVGFCMYIKRECLNDIGLFDAVEFPIGYGEESDFCYRAYKMGWRHAIAGDVFVTHLEGKSFGDRKARLMQEMFAKFERLHPEIKVRDPEFALKDPVRVLRQGLDLARIKNLLGGGQTLVLRSTDETDLTEEPAPVFLLLDVDRRHARFHIGFEAVFPNLDIYELPKDIAKLNADMRRLGVTGFSGRGAALRALEAVTAGKPYELTVEAELLENSAA